MKRTIIALWGIVCVAAAASAAAPDKKSDNGQGSGVVVISASYAGPYEIRKPFMVDEVDVNGDAFDASSAMDSPLSLDAAFGETSRNIQAKDGRFSMPSSDGAGYPLSLLGVKFSTKSFGKVSVEVEGMSDYETYMDGEKASSKSLRPGSHELVIKCLGGSGRISLRAEKSVGLVVCSAEESGEGRSYTLRDVMEGKRCVGVSMSASGRYLLTRYSTMAEGGEMTRSQIITDLSSGRILYEGEGDWGWLQTEDKCYDVSDDGRMTVYDPATGASEVRATGLPDGDLSMISYTDDFFIYQMMEEGPAERKDVYQILDPEDRQRGWRNRSYIAKYDIASGVLQRLTFGYHETYALDVSQDGRHLLFAVSRLQTSRPTALHDIYDMDLETMQVEKLVDGDGFVSGGGYVSPSGDEIVFYGSPESFGGIGKKVLAWQTPNMTEGELFLYKKDGEVRPLTKDFDPSVSVFVCDQVEGAVYFIAEDKDYQRLYSLRTKTGKITEFDIPEEYVKGLSAPEGTSVIAAFGQGSMNSDRIYTVDVRKGAVKLQEDLSAKLLDGVALGECRDWNFVDKDGYTIYGRFYLPPHFDESEKYPLIVNYYGGCSPTSRTFESRYPWHLYAAMGYVVYVVNPRGATGFGQEFAAYHVNTAGDYVADDIIEGTKKFVSEHPFVDGDKIGCIGASYGGFMTQWLQTKTDIFAAAISHAGISDHTSYWGNGYWGYSYSETSMAGSYPWSDKELFVDHSPLYNADKIHTPLLFLHGDADNNVPFMESVQMFTALKLLDRPTAFVAVEKQGHHITDYDKRVRWQDTIFAWFQKWLRDDPSWWDSLYPEKHL